MNNAELPNVTVAEHEGLRTLHLGDTPWVQGAMLVRAPRVLALEYVQRMMAWLLWRPLEALPVMRAVQLGLGAASLTRFAHGVLKLAQVTAVELNPSVIAACRQSFRLPADDARLAVVQADAATWVADAAHQRSADVLNVDLYDHEAAAPVLDTPRFYADCARVLAPGGVATINLFGRRASFEQSVHRIATAFGRDQVWTLRPTREGNTIVVAACGIAVPGRAVLLARAATIEQHFGLPARKWLRLVRPLS